MMLMVAVATVSTCAAADKPALRTPEAVEQSIQPLRVGSHGEVIPLTIERLMELNKVPGLSVVVIDNYEIAWAKAYGVLTPGEKSRATTRSLFLAGSVSKSVTAVGMMALVSQGRLSLDEDVNLKLKSWRVPDNDFTKEQKVTLRRIASHTAGLTVFGFSGYAIDEKLPTLQQILDGQAPANSPPVRVESIPGTNYKYSGGGTTVEQQVMIDACGQAFPALMKKTLFDKLAMSDSSFEQPLPRARAGRAASGAEADGRVVAGKWRVFPEMAAAGLWTTPTDLAKLAIEVALASKGRSNKVLSESLAREMLTAQPATNGEATLGFFVDPKHPSAFVNNGADRGFQTMLRMDADTGQGAILMANSENGFLVATEYMEAIAIAYDWKVMPTRRIGGRFLVLVAKVKGVDAALAAYEELKRAPTEKERPNEYTLSMLGDRLFEGGDKQGAIKALEKNTLEYPKSAAVYLNLGKAYAATSQQSLAIENFERAVVLDPAMEEAKSELARLKPSTTIQ
jgi:CubicO group peptidase (beta-lactamase class C family)